MSINFTSVAGILTSRYEAAGEQRDVLLREDEQGIRVFLDIGAFDVGYVVDEQVSFEWATLVPGGHHAGAAESTVKRAKEEDWLHGDLRLLSADDAGVGGSHTGDCVLGYRLGFDLSENASLNDDEPFADLVAEEAARLAAVIGQYEEWAGVRVRSAAAMEAHDRDWPAGLAALVDDSTSSSMLGILFQRFEGNSIHEHVFYHPNADRALRERIIASWDEVARPDRAQPFGDPTAASESFAAQRAESVAHLQSDAEDRS